MTLSINHEIEIEINNQLTKKFMPVADVSNFLGVLVILGQIFIAVILVFWLLSHKYYIQLTNFLSKNAILLAFVVALVATCGSLYYSEIANFTPCELCWFQRIFIYPQVVLLGIAVWRKEDYVLNYSLPLIGIGTIISLYHNYIYSQAKPTNFCSIVAPCTQKFVTVFGYISIPLMALTAFVLIGLLLSIKSCLHKLPAPAR